MPFSYYFSFTPGFSIDVMRRMAGAASYTRHDATCLAASSSDLILAGYICRGLNRALSSRCRTTRRRIIRRPWLDATSIAPMPVSRTASLLGRLLQIGAEVNIR